MMMITFFSLLCLSCAVFSFRRLCAFELCWHGGSWRILRFTILDLRFAIYDLRFAICDLRFTIYDLRFTILQFIYMQTSKEIINRFRY
jgi:hypothetical protein